ncbi:cell wall integrity and stress response component 4-like [Haliotis rufescens]|uniref:cell wall integrity and stress response component 4-like n=1 Tax=Haliotis rufescens TaxID=6454 RepID=UPI00201EA0F7|nr:cell wall integrity and stress response component 4-like [Haliotis rufescens]
MPTTATATTTPTTATTTSSNSSTAISSTTSGTTLSTSTNTKDSTPASITNSTEPTSSEIPTSTEASSATAETSTPSSTVITSSSVTTTVQPTTTSLAATSTSPPKTILLINEFTYNGLFSNDTTYGDNFSVEIRRLEGDATPNMTVVVSDLKMKCAAVVQVDSAAWNNNLAFETAHLTPANRRAVIVSLYTSVNWTNCTDVNMTGVDLLDATIVSQDLVNTTTTSIQFVPDYLSRILVAQVNRSIPQGANLSVVRCDHTRLDPGSFIIAPSTFNHNNSCDLNQNVTLKTITLNYTCDQWKDENTTKLINYFVKEVGWRCQCGFSPVYIRNATGNCTQTTTTTISWSIPERFESVYDNVVNATDCIENETSEKLCLARTCHNCNNSKKVDPQHKGNISVTVGVVIACIVVFLIIVAIVILYIRKKRRGILQFRMTRLDEDDDDLMMSNDTDDFVGGQEASFSNSSYTRFK